MSENKDTLLEYIRSGHELSFTQRLRLTMLLSTPAIMAQLASVMLQFIDDSMVGRLGVGPAASIGLVTTTLWVVGGFCSAASSGFSVQVAHLIGSNDFKTARKVLRQGISTVLIFSLLLTALGVSVADRLPHWLGGSEDICEGATQYFRALMFTTPGLQFIYFCGSMLQCSGNMKVPSIMNVVMCIIDIIFNFILIFPTREISIFGFSFEIYGAGLGVLGAALGTVIAQCITASILLYYLLCRSKELRIVGEKGSFKPTWFCLKKASGITAPMWLQNIIIRGAHIVSTVIVAPLGPLAIAANTFAITAESLCYMPGFGIADASTALVGQSLGARRKELASSFASMTVGLGVAIMSFCALLMYIFAPQILSILCNDPEVIALGSKCLRIEAFAEPMFAISIVGFGACVGGGDTMVPTLLNFVCMWGIRIALALILTSSMGLAGFWIAMCTDLNVRGLLYIWRLRSGKWMRLSMEKQ